MWVPIMKTVVPRKNKYSNVIVALILWYIFNDIRDIYLE